MPRELSNLIVIVHPRLLEMEFRTFDASPCVLIERVLVHGVIEFDGRREVGERVFREVVM